MEYSHNYGWRLIKAERLPGKFNMSFDRWLFEKLLFGEGKPTLRFFLWDKPTISYGMNQRNIESIIDYEKCGKYGVDIAKRPTGGRELLHGYDLSYSVVGFTTFDGNQTLSIRKRCAQIHGGIVEALISLGADKEGFEDKRRPMGYNLKGISPCFTAITGDEISYYGKKLVGSAQRSKKNVFLQQGSIQLVYGTSRIIDFLRFDSERKYLILKEKLEKSITDLSQIMKESLIDERVLEDRIAKSFSEEFGITFDETCFSSKYIENKDNNKSKLKELDT